MLTRPSLSVRSSTKALTELRHTSVILWFSSTSCKTPCSNTQVVSNNQASFTAHVLKTDAELSAMSAVVRTEPDMITIPSQKG